MSRVQERMKKLGIKQVDMILELRKRGITVQPPEMSSIIRGVYTYFKRKGNRVKGLGKDGDAIWWWERSPNFGTSDGFCYVSGNGGANASYAGSSGGVAFGFCV